MSKNNLMSGREKELQNMAEQYEQAKAEQRSIYMDAEDLADLADWYSVHFKRDMAFDVVAYGKKIHPDNISLQVEEAYLYLDDYDTDAAQQITDKMDANLSEVKILQAQIYIMNDKLDQAGQLLNTLKKKSDIDTMINVAYMFINVNFPKNALDWLKPGIGKYENDEQFLAVLGDTYYGNGMLDEAIETYNKLIDKNPYSASYWIGLGRCYFDQQQYDKAIEACDYAIISDDEFADAYLMKGSSFFFLQNDQKALENFEKAASLGITSSCFIDTFMGLCLCAQEKWKRASEHLQRAADTYNDDGSINLALLYANLAFSYWKIGQQEKSDHYWKLAYEANPHESEIYLLEAKMYLKQNQYDSALVCWQKALQYAPNANTWHEIGLTFMEYGDMEQARKAFERVKQLEPDFPELNEKLAVVYLLLKDKKNFQKYNQLCKQPITMEEMLRVHDLLVKENKENLVQVMKNILNALK